MADELTIQEAHKRTRVGIDDVEDLVGEAGIDKAELAALVNERTKHARASGYATVPAIVARAFVAGVLWEKSRGDS